jgi:glycosyltransferase involved in cell wall biosynthesis
MKKLLKKFFVKSPIFLKLLIIKSREIFYAFQMQNKENKEYSNLPRIFKKNTKVKNILIYHISGMFYAGTEKNLQLIANYLSSHYNVYFMYSLDNFSQRQKDLMNKNITFIEFTYSKVAPQFPHFIHGMQPHIKNIIHDKKIDLIITSSSGHSQYPFNTIQEIPIIVINIFGSPSVQKNIVATVFISKTILDYSETYTGKRISNSWAHLAVTPSLKNQNETRKNVREKLHIPEKDFIFGRIGRKSDDIFDPIGILSFKEVVKEFPNSHYLIMSPPPKLEKIVIEEKIPNVHYFSDKEDIWDFYYSLDALAHFRLDGESFGLNIAEAMYAGNPIISHISHIWNAHLEYLQPSFSRVTKKDDVAQYTKYMKEFITLKNNNEPIWQEMREKSKETAVLCFSKETYGSKIKNIIDSL